MSLPAFRFVSDASSPPSPFSITLNETASSCDRVINNYYLCRPAFRDLRFSGQYISVYIIYPISFLRFTLFHLRKISSSFSSSSSSSFVIVPARNIRKLKWFRDTDGVLSPRGGRGGEERNLIFHPHLRVAVKDHARSLRSRRDPVTRKHFSLV